MGLFRIPRYLYSSKELLKILILNLFRVNCSHWIGVDITYRELVLGCSAARDGPFAPAFDYPVQIVRVTNFTD
jgi:hypothetical protein